MALRIVRLGSPRAVDEGLRIGTVRRPPRGVPKSEIASRDIYDVWLPELAPSEELLKLGLAVEDGREWRSFAWRYRMEMKTPEKRHLLDLIAALSQHTNLAVGCYCAELEQCHRSLLADLLAKHGAQISSID